MKVNDLEIKVGINFKKFKKDLVFFSLTLILISINTPMTYLTHTLLDISNPFFKNYLMKFETLS